MPSPADPGRRPLEGTLRALAATAGLILLVRAVLPSTDAGAPAVATGRTLDSALVAWTVAAPARVRVQADVVPRRLERDWLSALRRQGAAVEWAGAAASGAAGATLLALPQPDGASRLAVVGRPATQVTVSDALGPIDSARTGAAGSLGIAALTSGAVDVGLPSARPSVQRRDSIVLRPVYVIGAAGWEAKFTIAALEEAGWSVRASLRVAPKTAVVQGPPVRLDTAEVGAVILLDSTASDRVAGVERFVASGGGLVVSGSAARILALQPLLPAELGPRLPGRLGGLDGSSPRDGLAWVQLTSMRAGALPLEARDQGVAVAARRYRAGRVVLTGYADTWRWRMLGAGDAAPAAHREWWSSLVASAVLARSVARRDVTSDEAPLAAMHATFGEPAGATPPLGRIPVRMLDSILFGLASLALLAEWLSRRLRGAP